MEYCSTKVNFNNFNNLNSEIVLLGMKDSHMTSRQTLDNRPKKQTLLSDAMLFLFAKEAEKKGECKLRMADIYKIMSHFQADFDELNIPITFEKTGTDIYSRRIDEAMYDLIAFDTEIVNPSFSIVLAKDAATRRLEKLGRRIPEEVRLRLNSMFEKFDVALDMSSS